MTVKDYSYVFIVTYGRSGSTLLQSLLNSLDGVQIRGENYNALFQLHRAIAAIEKTKNTARHRLVSDPDAPWYGAGELHPAAFRTALVDAFVAHVLRPQDGTRTLGFKEIRHMPNLMAKAQFTAYMDFLLEAFPNSKIVFNTRNAEDVAKSGWFAQLDPVDTKKRIRTCDERFARYNASCDRTIVMHYDDYVADHTRVKELFRFLGHDYDSGRVHAIFSKPLNHVRDQ